MKPADLQGCTSFGTWSQRKDTAAFAQLVTEFQPMVFRLAFRLLCDEDEARDITQETFVKVCKKNKRLANKEEKAAIRQQSAKLTFVVNINLARCEAFSTHAEKTGR